MTDIRNLVSCPHGFTRLLGLPIQKKYIKANYTTNGGKDCNHLPLPYTLGARCSFSFPFSFFLPPWGLRAVRGLVLPAPPPM
jgi:hypothetical protein